MSRESEVATYLAADSELQGLAPGGVYAASVLPISGLTDTDYMSDVWAGGVFNTTIVVRERAPVPTGDLQSAQTQRTSVSQAVEVWGYGTSSAAVEAALNRVYALMMGHRLPRAFSATWIGGGAGISQAPELPSGIVTGMESYRIVFIRRPVTA